MKRIRWRVTGCTKASTAACNACRFNSLRAALAASGNFGQVLRKNYPVVVANKERIASSLPGFGAQR